MRQSSIRHIAYTLAVTATLLSSACVTSNTNTERESSNTAKGLSPLSVTLAGFSLQPNDRIAWLPQAVQFYPDPRIDSAGIKRTIETAIATQMADRGYNLSLDTANADYLLAYTAAMESALDDRSILTQYGLLPGNELAGSTNRNYEQKYEQQYDKGSLIIVLVDARNRQPVWKSALQAQVDFEASASTRRQRIQQAVQTMLSTLPLARS